MLVDACCVIVTEVELANGDRGSNVSVPPSDFEVAQPDIAAATTTRAINVRAGLTISPFRRELRPPTLARSADRRQAMTGNERSVWLRREHARPTAEIGGFSHLTRGLRPAATCEQEEDCVRRCPGATTEGQGTE